MLYALSSSYLNKDCPIVSRPLRSTFLIPIHQSRVWESDSKDYGVIHLHPTLHNVRHGRAQFNFLFVTSSRKKMAASKSNYKNTNFRVCQEHTPKNPRSSCGGNCYQRGCLRVVQLGSLKPTLAAAFSLRKQH